MPCDYYRYPPNWRQIRACILERAGNRCEWCGADNYRPHPITGARVVLTIAHCGNPDTMDCRDENLAALCQRCHNRLDAPMRARHAAETRRRKLMEAGQMMLLPNTGGDREESGDNGVDTIAPRACAAPQNAQAG